MQKYLFPALMALFMACTATGEAQNKLLKVNDFEAVLNQEKTAQLIDVRTPEEYRSGHLQGAVNIDFYASDFKARMAKLDKNKPVMVYCAVGGRSGNTADMLKSMGFTKVYDLDGGYRAWAAGGKKTVQ